MQSFIRAFLFLGLLAALVAAAPSPKIQKRGVFKVERVVNPNFKGHNGPKQLLKSLRKYRMNIPPALMDSIRNQGSRQAHQQRRHQHQPSPSQDGPHGQC